MGQNRASDEAVRRELERIVASNQFQSSRLCQRFLEYVVNHTLHGDADSIKEQLIGIEVFGKSADYSPGEDAGVRVKAGEVRKRLRAFYQEHDAETVIIDLPVGTYVPVFRDARPLQETPDATTRGHGLSRWLWIGVGVLIAAAVAGIYVQVSRVAVPASLAQFWSPAFSGKKPALLCTAPVPVFALLHDPTPNHPTTVSDYVAIPDQFVAVGDLTATSQIADMMTRMHWAYRLRIANDVTFRDFRSTPVVLVGFSYTRWDDLNRGQRYSIDLGRRPLGILDHGQPTKWTIPTNPDDPQLSEDYAILSRIFDQDTGNILIEITGISHYGTEAAADLVTNPDLLQKALAQLPAGWQKKNLQIVLHASVIAGAAANPSVVATHVW